MFIVAQLIVYSARARLRLCLRVRARIRLRRSYLRQSLYHNHMSQFDDWHAYALEMWGICITSWTPLPERAAHLPDPLEYDVLQDGLMELEQAERRTVLQGVSCYQVNFLF